MARGPRRSGRAGRIVVGLLPRPALGFAPLGLAWGGFRPPGGAFAQFAVLDWYRHYLGARLPFRPAFAPFGFLDAWWGDWHPAFAAYALTGVAPDVPRGCALLWRVAALALPVALALYALGLLQLAAYRAAGPALAARVAAGPRPLARGGLLFVALLPWAWATFYLALVAAPLPPTADGPPLAAYLLLGPANPALTKHHDLRLWAVVTNAAALWTSAAALLLGLARGVWARDTRPPFKSRQPDLP